MNDRIQLESPTRVNIQVSAFSRYKTTVGIDNNGITVCQEMNCIVWDKLGLEALQEALACYSYSGSFAALHESSPEPCPGKRMRYRRGLFDEPEITILAIHEVKSESRKFCLVMEDCAVGYVPSFVSEYAAGSWVTSAHLYPLNGKPGAEAATSDIAEAIRRGAGDSAFVPDKTDGDSFLVTHTSSGAKYRVKLEEVS